MKKFLLFIACTFGIIFLLVLITPFIVYCKDYFYKRRRNGYYSALRICRFVSLVCAPGSPSTGIRLLRRWVRLHSFSANHFKNWLFLSLACGKFTRMAAKLRPHGASNNAARTCGWTSRMQGLETAQFSHRFAEKECSRTLRRRRRMPVLGEPGHKQGRQNGIGGGLSSNPVIAMPSCFYWRSRISSIN